MKNRWILMALLPLLAFLSVACDDEKTYSDMKDAERAAVKSFIREQGINVISFKDFVAQDSTTDLERNEYVLMAKGVVKERSSKNPELPTGDIEIDVKDLRVLSKSETPPFDIVENCKTGVVIINTSRGALIDAAALLKAIKSRKVGGACLDVYEEESDLFFEDNSGHILEDDTLARLISMPNVIVTSHQAFLTREALDNIAETTINNIASFLRYGRCENELCYMRETTEDC